MRKENVVKIAIIVGVGLGLNILILGSLFSFFAYLTIYKTEAPGHLINFFSDPLHMISTLFFGGSTLAEQRAHEFFLDVKVQGFYWIIFILLSLKHLSFKQEQTRTDKPEFGSHGTSRFKTEKEIMQMTGPERKGFILGLHQGKEVIHDVNDHLNQFVTVFGGTGSGKSASLVIPNVLHTAKTLGDSMVITDPKGEIYDMTKETLERLGYNILYLNLWDLKKSMRYNPLDYINEENPSQDTENITRMIIDNTEDKHKTGGDQFWTKAETALLKTLILYVKECFPKEMQHMSSVLEMGLTVVPDQDYFDSLISELPANSATKRAYNVFKSAPDRTRDNIITGFGARLQLWTDPDVGQLTSTSDFNINDLGNQKTALFLIIQDANPTFDLIPSLMIEQIFRELYTQATKSPGRKLKVPVRLFLDELGNIAPINNLPRRIGAMRSRGISCCLIFQSINQFKDRYGEATSKEILDSCNTIILLGTDEEESKEYFSKKLGVTTTETIGISESKNDRGESSGKSSGYTQRPLMTPDEIGRLNENKLIVFQKSRYPMILDKNYCFAWQNWNEIPQVSWPDDLMDREDEELALPSFEKENIPTLETVGRKTPHRNAVKPTYYRQRKRPNIVAANSTEKDILSQIEKPKKKGLFTKKKKSVAE